MMLGLPTLLPRRLRVADAWWAALCVGALSNVVAACGSSGGAQRGQAAACASGQVACAGCGSNGFCATGSCPAVSCPVPSDGGVEDGSLPSGSCPSGQTACSDCSGGSLCVAGGCGAVQCPPASLDAGADVQNAASPDASTQLRPCADAACPAPSYCFLLACGSGTAAPDAARCAQLEPVCAPLPADCADASNPSVQSCPSGAGIYYCNMINAATHTVPCGYQ
jgi:hypothetical protein